MFGALARRLFGSANDRYVQSLQPLVDQINEIEPELEKLSDEALRARTAEFRQRLEDGAELDDLLVEAFATVREASKRTLGQRHFDVQLMGGIVLHRGMIAEMKTGEGKTLVSTLPVYLNALTGRAPMSSPSTIISPSATPNGWGRSTGFSASVSAASSTNWTIPSASRPISATS